MTAVWLTLCSLTLLFAMAAILAWSRWQDRRRALRRKAVLATLAADEQPERLSRVS